MYTNDMRPKLKPIFPLLAALLLKSGAAHGHAADQGFVLLLPTAAYISGGTAVVAATIALLFILRASVLDRVLSPIDTGLSRGRLRPQKLLQFVSSGGFLALIWLGISGPTDPQANLMPLVLWTVWWMAMFVVQGFVFDIWRLFNPLVGFYDFLMSGHKSPLRLSKKLSVWPAVLVFTAFMGFVLADTAPNDPERLAWFAFMYWLFTFLGMTLFGRDAWLRQVECFTVLFDLLGTMRIAGGLKTVKLGFPGWQAFQSKEFGLSHAMFVLVLLASGSFDGLHETFWWLAKLGVNPLEYPGRTAMVASTTLGLAAGIISLTLLFAGAVWVGLLAVTHHDEHTLPKFKQAFIRFSITLLPIAIGYHFAHYFVSFLVQIQVVVATLADPLAKGWNLFGLGGVRVKVGFLTVPETVKLIWLFQAGIVVLSHVLAVLLSHKTAEMFCTRRQNVLRLQLGLSFVMVVYTIFGLWLLASPRGV
ncbi:hypothetical protein SAMN05444287_0229 [Octadecabacter temperatus]|uniref:Uncharacterized protein n=1 Tax=Octadecabacter temperatus TaxID=1458307 RepID=A0A0K0Y2H3_9RHOB|nr:hypothetical protein [Octadecabacter temperatus]AKS45138.1 hypothetical protein OSB_05770 [Octadecabacter temperatus]SIN86921.1 hypothetical protein SAMN05444287_0229 [Octadecabacter temperatus]